MVIVELEQLALHLIEEQRLPLVNRFYADCNYNVRCGRLDRVYTFEATEKIIAAARLLPTESSSLLLRNLCVLPEHRQQGIAARLLQKILVEIAPHSCYCFALPHLKNFYLTSGFRALDASQVPEDIATMHSRHQARKRGWLLMGTQENINQ